MKGKALTLAASRIVVAGLMGVSLTAAASAGSTGHAPGRKAVVKAPLYSGPGPVTVLPASALPQGAVLPPARGMGTATAMSRKAESAPVTSVAGKKAPADFYIVSNPELRWQFYSYP